MKTRILGLLHHTIIFITLYFFYSIINASSQIKSNLSPLRLRKGSQKTSIKKTVSIQQMTPEELSENLQHAVKKKQWTLALKYIELLVKTANDPIKIADLLFLMGSIYFDTGEFSKAIIVFDDFILQFKSHPAIKTASYKATLASYYLTLDSERDQTQTRKTIERADAYLNSNCNEFKQEIKVLRADCFRKLADHELYVCNTLLKYRGNRKGTEQRLNELLNTIVPEVPEIKDQVIALQESLKIKLHGTTKNETQSLL